MHVSYSVVLPQYVDHQYNAACTAFMAIHGLSSGRHGGMAAHVISGLKGYFSCQYPMLVAPFR